MNTTDLDETCDYLEKHSRELRLEALEAFHYDDFPEFRDLLTESARERVKSLELMETHQNHGYFRAAGRFDCFFDAIVAQDWDAAKTIANLSARELVSGEDEEDHFYGRLLHKLFDQDNPDLDLPQLLSKFAEAEEGVESVRLDVMEALVANDSLRFHTAFTALCADFENNIRHGYEPPPELVEPVPVEQRLLFLEGLTLLTLAARRGLETKADYPHCPTAAR